MAGAKEALAHVHRTSTRSRRAIRPQVGVTGGAALATEEMLASVRDTNVAAVLSLLGVGLCFVLFYRDIVRRCSR